MAPPQANPNHGRMSPTKDLTHRVRSGSVQKKTSPTSPVMAASMQIQGPPQSVPQNSARRSANAILTQPRTPTAPNALMIQVLVHNPTNNNDFASRPSHVNVLSRSPYFLQRIRAFTQIDVPVLHIVAELEYYDIVANWLSTNNVRTRQGGVPDCYTLTMVIFLADIFQLPQLCTQIVNMMRLKQYAISEVHRAPQSYFDIYQKTSVGNPFRRFVVESYVSSDMGVIKPCVPLVDLPAAMLVDIIQLREETWGNCSQKAFDERLVKAEEELKKDAEKRFNNNEAERVKVYEERLVKAKEAMTSHGNAVAPEGVHPSTVFRRPLMQAPTSESIGSTLLEDLKRTHEKLMDEVKRKSDERYDSLVEVMRQRNSEHLEAVQIMDKATQAKEARLMSEIEALRTFKQESTEAAQSTADESAKSMARLRSIIKEREETKNVLLQEIDVLKREFGKSRMNTQLVEMLKLPLEVQNIEELNKTIHILKKANDDLKKANEDLEEDAGRHYSELAELKRVHANSEERNRRQLDSLHKKVNENAQKYRKDIEDLQAKLKENSDAYKKELVRLKKVNRELLDQLTVDDEDDD
ncbi:hypothetical protein BKA61DRAFT_262408 [Leptodontidium sp. MPI-SDFR-AT-0119]|nr:hypothetical protein BKA61DRAFT_262408 [Leptodontidium sp. MPI-SDFR-AT-0119]